MGRRWLAALGLALLVGPSPVLAQGVGLEPEHWPGEATLGPGAVFESIETAAVDALAFARHHATPADRGRFRLGTIHRVEGGYSYAPPIRSTSTVWSSADPVLRFRLGPQDVATYVLHPASGRDRLDRLNERPSASERRLVDRGDPLGRPLFLLTPSRRVVRYERKGEAPVELIAALPESR